MLDRLLECSFLFLIRKNLMKSSKGSATNAFGLKTGKQHEQKFRKLFALLWTSREPCDLQVSNKVILERVISMMRKSLVKLTHKTGN
jgi:hypothetical protein